jgi:pyruvate formate lyase activating enzyme
MSESVNPVNKFQNGPVLIFDIKHYAIHDGPGIRSTIFLKGCPLACIWCHNPEGRSPKAEKMVTASKCIGCRQCVESCPQQACRLTSEGIVTDTKRCTVCGKCAEVCGSNATEMAGRSETVESMIDVLKKEVIFFDQSGGGVTVSGGEPLMFPKFLSELLDECGKIGIHRTLDTSGYAGTEILLEVSRRVELFLYDIKMMDSAKHKKYTGVDNAMILHNLKGLAESGANICIRIPLIEGINDDDKNIDETAAFINALAGEKKRVELLPYHNSAIHKYRKLGRSYNADSLVRPDESRQQQIIERFRRTGISARLA